MVKLFGDKNDPATWRILISAKYANVNVDVEHVNVGVDNKSKEFLAKSPLGKAPVLETSDGALSEPNAIVRYFARVSKSTTFYGSSPFEASEVDQWLDFAAQDIELPGSVWVFPVLGFIPNNAVATQKAKGDVRKALEVLNKHLQTRTFLVGQRISIADVTVATALLRLYQHVLDPAFRKAFVNTNRWFLTVVNQPNFKAIVPEVKLADKMAVAPEGGAAEEGKAGKAEAKPKEEKKKAAEKPAEKPAAKPKKKEAEEEEEEEFKEEVKKSALDSLPPSKFNLEEWKRVYTNQDSRKEAIPWFWSNLDKEGFSIWFGDYKYNAELDSTLRTSNLLGGFIQRLDRLRKYGFGSLVIFGEEPKLEVSVCFLFRGQDIPQEMKEVDDCELYDWRKADLGDAATVELINDFWAWDGNFNGRKFNRAKAFK